MTINTELGVDACAGGAFHQHTPSSGDGRVAGDLLIAFEPLHGSMTDSIRVEIDRWTQTWLASHPGAVVVMGCNGKSRNSTRPMRESRLLAIGRALADLGVSEDRVRYTDEVLELDSAGSPIAEDRGILCIKVFRSSVLDTSVMAISDLFRCIPAPADHDHVSAS